MPNRAAHLILVPLLALLASCIAGLPPLPPLPPTYDDNCAPSHTEYLTKARDRQHRLAPSELAGDMAAMRDYCWAQTTSRGWLIAIKAEKDPSAGWSTTIPTPVPTVALTRRWSELDTESQAATICHELVHVKQAGELGTTVFLGLWLTSHGRFALEVPAFSDSLSVHEAAGQDVTPSARLETWAELADEVGRRPQLDADRFVEKYRLSDLPISTMPHDCAVRWAEQIWSEGRSPLPSE